MHPCDNLETLLRTLQPSRRNNYFYGKRMDVQHFQMEQDYGKLKQWLLNRLTFGKGVVCGLKVSIDGNLLCVDPGFAIDGLGREIVVPVRACIDPVTQEGGCCVPCCQDAAAAPQTPLPPSVGTAQPSGGTGMTAAPAPQPQPAGVAQPDAAAAGAATDTVIARVPPTQPPPYATGIFTLWLCYRECRTDYEPVLVSDCGTRDQCAPGTIVETYCLKMTPGAPPLQGDPEWCSQLWPKTLQPDNTPGKQTIGKSSRELYANLPATMTSAGTPGQLTLQQENAALTSRRRLLCQLFDGTCESADSDPCVPLALVLLREKNIVRFDSCLVRPRVYSNATLLDLILCLADKIDECCGSKSLPQLMHVSSVDFLGGSDGAVIATVQSPLDNTVVPIRKQGTAIRVKFDRPFDQVVNKPTTPGPNDASWKRHNFVVIPVGGARAGYEYVPGSLTIERPDTLRWDLDPSSPFYAKDFKGWQKGELSLEIFGDADAANNRNPVSSAAGVALDGEPIAPAGGVMSGNGTAGGNFITTFRIG